jgi:hypothetical protein
MIVPRRLHRFRLLARLARVAVVVQGAQPMLYTCCYEHDGQCLGHRSRQYDRSNPFPYLPQGQFGMHWYPL